MRTAIDRIRRPEFDPSLADIASFEAKRTTKRAIQLAEMIEDFSRTMQSKQ